MLGASHVIVYTPYRKKVKRLICSEKFNAHTDQLFKKLNILKVKDIFRLRAIKFYFRYIQDQLPLYFNDIFATLLQHTHSYETKNRENIHLAKPDKVTSEHCVRY